MAEAETALELAKSLTWGTYGPGAVEAHETQGTPLPPLTFKPLGECDTDHLEAILAHVVSHPSRYTAWNPSADELIVVAVQLILEERRASPNHCPTCGAFPVDLG